MSRAPGLHQVCLTSHRLYKNYLARTSTVNAGFSFSGKTTHFFREPMQQVLKLQPWETQGQSKGHSQHRNGLCLQLTTKIFGGLCWRPNKNLYDINHFHHLVFHFFCSQSYQSYRASRTDKTGLIQRSWP